MKCPEDLKQSVLWAFDCCSLYIIHFKISCIVLGRFYNSNRSWSSSEFFEEQSILKMNFTPVYNSSHLHYNLCKETHTIPQHPKPRSNKHAHAAIWQGSLTTTRQREGSWEKDHRTPVINPAVSTQGFPPRKHRWDDLLLSSSASKRQGLYQTHNQAALWSIFLVATRVWASPPPKLVWRSPQE